MRPPSKRTRVTPVYLDEDDELVAAVPPTPTDGGFRRGLFVMLTVLGMLAAMSLITSRQNNRELTDARNGEAIAQQQVLDLIAAQERAAREAEERFRRAEQERVQLAERSLALERLLVAILARSEDPALREAFEDFAAGQGITTDLLVQRTEPLPRRSASASPRRTPDPAPTRTRRPTPRPTSRPPSPSPSPSRTEIAAPIPHGVPVPRTCVLADGYQVCTNR